MPTPTGYTSAYTHTEIDERLGAVPNKADKIQEVNHGTSDTTFTLTPNVMHIWGTVASLNLSLPTDSNSTLDEYLFTFTCGSTPTTLTLPATIKWIQDPEFEENKTYQVSIVNNLAGYLTNGMVAGSSGGGGGENNVIESISVNGVAQTVSSKNVDITVPTDLSDLADDSTHRVVTDTEKSTWSGKQDAINDLSDIRSGASLGATALQSYTETDPTVPSWAKQSTKPSYTASEVGAVPTSRTVNGKALSSNISLSASDVGALPDSTVIPTVPTNVSSFTNDANYVSSTNTVAIYSGSSAPSSSTGKNGDIYIQTS